VTLDLTQFARLSRWR